MSRFWSGWKPWAVCLVVSLSPLPCQAQVGDEQPQAPNAPRAQEPPQARPPAEKVPLVDGEQLEFKKAWLREQLRPQLKTERQLMLMLDRVEKMNAEQLERAIDVQKRKARKLQRQRQEAKDRGKQLEALRQNQQLQLLAANLAANMRQRDRWADGFRDGLWAGRRQNRVVGWAPVVTWLPAGTQPVLGRRGRYFYDYRFPYVGPVDHVHFVPVNNPQPTPREEPRVWFDGLRTRYGVPSGNLHRRF